MGRTHYINLKIVPETICVLNLVSFNEGSVTSETVQVYLESNEVFSLLFRSVSRVVLIDHFNREDKGRGDGYKDLAVVSILGSQKFWWSKSRR